MKKIEVGTKVWFPNNSKQQGRLFSCYPLRQCTWVDGRLALKVISRGVSVLCLGSGCLRGIHASQPVFTLLQVNLSELSTSSYALTHRASISPALNHSPQLETTLCSAKTAGIIQTDQPYPGYFACLVFPALTPTTALACAFPSLPPLPPHQNLMPPTWPCVVWQAPSSWET